MIQRSQDIPSDIGAALFEAQCDFAAATGRTPSQAELGREKYFAWRELCLTMQSMGLLSSCATACDESYNGMRIIRSPVPGIVVS